MTPGRILSVSVTEAGRGLATRLPYEHVHGRLGETVRAWWSEVDGFVLFAAVGVAVRVAGPLLSGKQTDPALVCVDEAGRFAVAVTGGHPARGPGGVPQSVGANRLAEEVAGLLGAVPVVTTATDSAGVPALDTLLGFVAAGDVAGVTRALLDGEPVELTSDLPDWPLPASLVKTGPAPADRPAGRARLLVTDRSVTAEDGLAVLHPPSLVAGMGASTGAPPEEAAALLAGALSAAGLARASLAEVATLDRKASEPAFLSLGLPVRAYPAERLAAQPVPHPSAVVEQAVGTPSVSEAAALLAAGPGGELVVAKRSGPHVTVALARRRRPRGHLAIVGLGPGEARHRTPAASEAVRGAEVVIGYGPYLIQAADLLTAGQEVVDSPIGDELGRAARAVAEAEAGRRVALVCSGDAGIYALASIVFEHAIDGDTGGHPRLRPPGDSRRASRGPGHSGGDSRGPGRHTDADIEVVPGVTAAVSAASLLGAPLGHDHAAVSLSDLLTPWPDIERRLEAAAAADLVLSLYNPRSRGRPDHLERARTILLAHRCPGTPVGIVTDAYRPGQRVELTTLGDLDPERVGMTTIVIVGSSTTRMLSGRMVTPRRST